jgi:hypothetical protein
MHRSQVLRSPRSQPFAVLAVLTATSGFLPAARAQTNNCADAPFVGLGTYNGSTTGMTDDGDATCGSSANTRDVWFKYRADEDCLLLASTCDGANYDTVLSAHSACPGTEGNELACNDDACGLQSTIGVRLSAGETTWIRVSGFAGAFGSFTLSLTCREPPVGNGPDLTATSIDEIRQVGRVGSTVAISMESKICNVGSEAIDWFANPNPRHPFLVFDAYRLLNDRLEQIGQSWIKHGFAASESSICGLPCVPTGGSQLGAGCADIYGVGTNASQDTMGPRTEVNPWTGVFVWAGSHLATHSGGHNAIQHRLQVADADLNPATNPGARYFADLYVVTHDDVDHTNSVGWKPFRVTGTPGGTWTLSFLAAESAIGTVLDAWDGAQQTVIPDSPSDDGRAVVAAKVTDNLDGTWHYEFAVYNLDMDRGVAAFSVPVPASTTVTNAGIHAVRSHDEAFSNADWTFARETESVRWSTVAFGGGLSNPLRWGTLYNFRFDADAPPEEVSVTLGSYKPGGPGSFSGLTLGPSAAARALLRRGDGDGNGVVEITDAIFVLLFLFSGGPAPGCLDAADANDDGVFDISDAVFDLVFLFKGGVTMPPPGALTCGEDPTDEEPDLGPCEYDEKTCV